ncbi:hypothetical protein LDENG_00167780 [Lucifuga dentata]|nr:hypothetical protein LDENG_00167780 [Lucifuga dentata]
MDDVIFRHDSVLSDVHLLLPNERHLMTRLNRAGQPVFFSRFRILWENSDTKKGLNDEDDDDDELKDDRDEESKGRKDGGNRLDEDGDLDIIRRPKMERHDSERIPVCPVIVSQSSPDSEEEDDEDHTSLKDILRIEHTMATPLNDVGKQVWRGAFLLTDFILSQPITFRGATVLELGAGTGLTSIMAATLTKTVYCTDVGDDVLSMCQRNVTLNSHLLQPAGGEVKVKQLDWLTSDLCTDAEVEFSWTDEEVADLFDNTTFIIAADVFYDDDLTDGFFQTLYRLCSGFPHTCVTYISVEKRMNFTLRHLDVSCEAYDHFRRCLSQLSDLVDGRVSFSVERLPPTFPQFLQYERIEQLELWKLISTPLPSSPGLHHTGFRSTSFCRDSCVLHDDPVTDHT